jgi:hypothetical protein
VSVAPAQMGDDKPPSSQTVPTDPAALPMVEWYYEKRGTRYGPVTTEAIRALLSREYEFPVRCCGETDRPEMPKIGRQGGTQNVGKCR